MSASLTVSWEDPLETLAAAAGLSGLDYLRAIGEGRLPKAPIAELMGFDGLEAEEGRVVFTAIPGEQHSGGSAPYTTLEVKVNFARAITRDTGRIVCEGTVVHRGRTVASAEGRVVAEATGKLLAHGTTTCMIMSRNGRS